MARSKSSRGKVFRDPVHRLIRIDPEDAFILELIDTPEFQRLRRIRQLGVSWLTYHGAEHSRFSHSMGVFNFAQRILRSLEVRYAHEKSFVEYLNKHNKEVKAAALLHDVGHSPFSHLMERVFEKSSSHESQTVQLINDGVFAGILSTNSIEPKRVSEIIEGTSEMRLFVDVVSSQLDADRMDYLLRDSLFTGVEYGRYDSEWVVRNLCIGLDPSSGSVDNSGSDFSRYRLCLDGDRGLYSAEQLILARMHMTLQVYMHRVTRGYEVLLLNLFRLASELKQLPEGTPDPVREFLGNKGEIELSSWDGFDEVAMVSAIATWSRSDSSEYSDLKRLSTAFLTRDRIFKSRPIDNSNFGFDKTMKLKTKLEKIGKQGLHWEIDEGKLMPYKGLVYAATKPRIDPEEQSAESILLASGDLEEKAVPVDTKSQIFKTLDFQSQIITRVYYDRDKAADIELVLDEFGIGE